MSAQSRQMGYLIEVIDRELPDIGPRLRSAVAVLRRENARRRAIIRGALPTAATPEGHIRNIGEFYTDALLDVATMLNAANMLQPLADSHPAAAALRRAIKEFLPRYGSMEVLERSAKGGR